VCRGLPRKFGCTEPPKHSPRLSGAQKTTFYRDLDYYNYLYAETIMTIFRLKNKPVSMRPRMYTLLPSEADKTERCIDFVGPVTQQLANPVNRRCSRYLTDTGHDWILLLLLLLMLPRRVANSKQCVRHRPRYRSAWPDRLILMIESRHWPIDASINIQHTF